MIGGKAQTILLERDAGISATTLARRYGVSHQRVSAIVRDAAAFVNRVELDLMVARKTGDVIAYLVPYGPDYGTAMAFGDWLLRRLRDRDLIVNVSTRRASNGLALLFEDRTYYPRGGKL